SRRNYNNLEDINKKIKNLTRRIEDDFKNCLVCNLGSQELQLQGCLESEIKYIVEIKPYLIVLFRLLKCIHTTQKISDGDKQDYYALVRGLIPMEILLLILFNSQVWLEEEKLGQVGEVLNYKKLLKKAKLFEHLPIEDKILQRLLASDWLDKFLDRHKGLLPKGYMEERFFISILNNGEFIDEKAFGDSVYVKNIREKLQKHNNTVSI
ncbi:MAG: putative phage abortive infection protein, partial [Conchiformibius sp.]|nr:putative phage abortive infection protein [Conchiformibius sp.]